MCNINIIINNEGEKSLKLSEAMNVVSYRSYLNNDDAEGWFTEDFEVMKGVEKQIMEGEHSLIVSHQRRSTSGKNEKMAQPLEGNTFIVVHNGIFSGLGDVKKSDTYDYLMKLESDYENTKDTIKTIQNVNKTVGGYYSVVLYNKETKELYYYKDTDSNMFFIKSNKYLCMSTDKVNVAYLKKYFDMYKCVVAEVDPLNIYDLKNNFKKVGKFEMKPVKSYGGWYGYGKGYYDWDEFEKTPHKPKKKKTIEDKIPKNARDIIEELLVDSYDIEVKSIGIHGKDTWIKVDDNNLPQVAELFDINILRSKPRKKGKTDYTVEIKTKDLLDEYDAYQSWQEREEEEEE